MLSIVLLLGFMVVPVHSLECPIGLVNYPSPGSCGLYIDKNIDTISFYPYFYVKDLLSFFIFLFVFIFLVCFYPNLLGHPDNYVMADCGSGVAYLSKKVTKELELEGYSREIMRRIQQLRKDSQLNKRDFIVLNISGELDISSFENIMKEKVGAKTISYNNKDDVSNDFQFASEETVKGKKFSIKFNKV
jgi:hypothetical protein